MKIEALAKTLNFDALDDDMFAELFTPKQIVKDFAYEDAIPNSKETLPEDYLWYLENYGSRAVRDMEYRVAIGNDTSIVLSFDGCEAPQSACQVYRYHTRTGAYGYRLEEMKDGEFILDSKFVPFTPENQGKMMVIDIKDTIGSIWQFPSMDDCDKFDLEYKPSYVAPSFTVFLSMIKPSYAFKDALVREGFKEVASDANIWKKNVLTFTELFYHVLAEYENKTPVNYIEFKDEADFLRTLVAHPEKIIVNEARAVEFFFIQPGCKISNEDDFIATIERTQNLNSKLTQKRLGSSLSALEQVTGTDTGYIGSNHSFFQTTIKSTINGSICEETFALFKNPETQKLSFVKRIKIEIEALKIKGLGTFEFDYTWSSKRKVKVAWSEISARLFLDQFEEGFTDAYIAFAKEVINDISVKEKVEQYIFDRYHTIDYPEFLAQDKQTREEWKEAHPIVEESSDIWKTLGKEFDIHFIDNHTFDIHFEYSPDPEHGLSLTVKNGTIM